MSDIIQDLRKESQKDGSISAAEYAKKFEKKFQEQISDFPEGPLDGKPSREEVNAIDDFLKSKIDAGISQDDYNHIFAPMMMQLQQLATERENESGESAKTLSTLKEEASANKKILDIWRKKDRAALVPETPELAKIKNINTALVVMATLQQTTTSFDLAALTNAYHAATGGKNIDANTALGLKTLFEKKDDDTIKNFIAIFPDPTQNEVFAVMRGTASSGDYKQALSDFDFSGSAEEYQRHYASDKILSSKKEQRKHAQTVDMIGSMTGTMMQDLLGAVESFYAGNPQQSEEKLAALYASTHANEAKILFSNENPSFEDIMSNPVAIAQLQTSLAQLGYEGAYDFLTGSTKKVESKKLDNSEISVEPTEDIKESLDKESEACYQKFTSNAQALIIKIKENPEITPAEQREQIQEILHMMNNREGLKAQFQSVMWNAMMNVADSQVRKQMAFGAGVGKTAVLENLKFLQKQGFLHTVSGNMGMALAPLKNGAGLSLGLAVSWAGTQVNDKGESFFYSVTPSLGTSALAGKGGLQFLPIQFNARLNIGKDFLLNPKANSKDFALYKQNLVKSALYAGPYAYVDLMGAGGGVYMRRDKEKGIDDKRQAMEEHFSTMLSDRTVKGADSADEVYTTITQSFGDGWESKRDAPTESELRQMAAQLFEMKQAILTASNGDENKQISLITTVASNAATLWETSYRNSRKNGFWNSLSITGASAGVGLSFFGLRPVIEAGVSLGWVKGNRIEADQNALVDIQQRLETMQGAVDIGHNRDSQRIGMLNKELGLEGNKVLKISDHNYENELGETQSFPAVSIPKSLLQEKTDTLGFLIDPRYAGYIKEAGDGLYFTFPATLLNIQTTTFANATHGKRHYLTIGFGGDATATYHTMMESDIQKGDGGFKQWEKLRYEVEFGPLHEQFEKYMKTPNNIGKSPNDLLEVLQAKSKATPGNLSFMKNKEGQYFFTKEGEQVYAYFDNTDETVAAGTITTIDANNRKYMKIPLIGHDFSLDVAMKGDYISRFNASITPRSASDKGFKIHIDDTSDVNVLQTDFSVELGDVAPEVYAIMTDHKQLMDARYGLKGGRYGSGSTQAYNDFNDFMETGDLSNAGTLNTATVKAKKLFLSLANVSLTKEDCRGLFDALCLVHRTRNKSFKNEIADKPIVAGELLTIMTGKGLSNENKLKIEEKDPVALEDLIDGKLTNPKGNHRHNVNDPEYQYYWMQVGLYRVEGARGIWNGGNVNNPDRVSDKNNMNPGFDYPTLLSKMNYSQAAKNAFFENYQSMLKESPAKQASLGTMVASDLIKQKLKEPANIGKNQIEISNDVVMYPNAVTMVYGGDNNDPDRKFGHHGLFVKGLEKDIGSDPGSTERKTDYLAGVQKTEYRAMLQKTLTGNGSIKNADGSDLHISEADMQEYLKNGKKLDGVMQNGKIGSFIIEPQWKDAYYVQCFNPAIVLSLTARFETTEKQENESIFQAPPCKEPTPYRNVMAQGVRVASDRGQFGMSAAYQLPEAKAEKPTVSSDPNAEPLKPGEDIDGNVFGNPDDPWTGNTYHDRWKDLKNNSPETRSAMNQYIEANKGTASYGTFRNQMIDQRRGLVNGGMNPNKALRQIMGMSIVIAPTSAAGATLNIKHPNPVDTKAAIGDIERANAIQQRKQEEKKYPVPKNSVK